MTDYAKNIENKVYAINDGDVFDAIVVGAGHAGCEACLALARTGQKTLIINLIRDNIAFLPCNPSIGGTAKGHRRADFQCQSKPCRYGRRDCGESFTDCV